MEKRNKLSCTEATRCVDDRTSVGPERMKRFGCDVMVTALLGRVIARDGVEAHVNDAFALKVREIEFRLNVPSTRRGCYRNIEQYGAGGKLLGIPCKPR